MEQYMANNHLISDDPSNGLRQYILAVKPYHTKIVEVDVEYVSDEVLYHTVSERFVWNLSSIVTPPEFQFIPGTMWSWGHNGAGQLGDGTVSSKSSPIQVGLLNDWKQISNSYHSASIKSDGTLWAWGDNTIGQLGQGNTTDTSSPVQVGSLTDWKQVSCGSNMTAATKTDGTLWVWGSNFVGELGDGTTTSQSSPIQIGLLSNWDHVACDAYGLFTSAIKTDGTLWAWGDNGYGQLGQGNNLSTSSPVQVGSLTDWKQVSCGYSRVAAIKTDGTLWGCGYNDRGAMGDNSPFGSGISSPIQIGLLTNWSVVECGNDHNVAIKTDGTLWTWGYNFFGQLGDNTIVNKSSPIQVGVASDWVTASAGQYNISAIKLDGTLWTWGNNNSGQLGDGTTTPTSSPVQIGMLTDWKSVACGYKNTIAVK
jgi:alpha-tubulin suppressor-like RCC1 family protein